MRKLVISAIATAALVAMTCESASTAVNVKSFFLAMKKN